MNGMNNKYEFKKLRLIKGILFFILFLGVSISFLLKPDIFIRNVFMKALHVQIIGAIGIIYFSALLYSYIRMLSRKNAIIITQEFLIDNSKYESLGEIKWSNISEIKKLKKRSIEIHLKTEISKNRNLIKKFLSFMNNWNYKNSIVISSALLDCSNEELLDTMKMAYQNFKVEKQ